MFEILLDAFLKKCFGHGQPGGGLGADPGHVREITSFEASGTAHYSPWKGEKRLCGVNSG